ncbi:hypothetical protein [Bacillus sp. XF8]|uniref:hypothetical protein n=1 Tax=Bacillus sp. XF8 TaxID=2819289 RepID=UPI001AA05706|nr:hypothetical protein [Bacillus sp. XF8]MBO1579981.1 hypothetical protein [Bacillus sp. XF8]
MGREITVNFEYRDIDGLKQTKYTAYLLTESIYYEINGNVVTFRQIPTRELGKSEINVYDSDRYKALEIYCENIKGDIEGMLAVEFIEMLLEGQAGF